MLKMIWIAAICAATGAMADDSSFELDATTELLRTQFRDAKVASIDRYFGKWEMVSHSAYAVWRTSSEGGEWKRDYNFFGSSEAHIEFVFHRSGKLVVAKQTANGETSYQYYQLKEKGLVGLAREGYGYYSFRVTPEGDLVAERITPEMKHTSTAAQGLGRCEEQYGMTFYRHRGALGDEKGCAEAYLSSY